MTSINPSTETIGGEEIETIGREELKGKLDRGDEFRLVMALNDWAFRAKHIPRSEHFDSLEAALASLKPDEDIVVYCTSPECHSSIALYMALREAGYQNVRRYSGGLSDWEEAGLPLEGDWA
jgi:rhodanese-related sulfurtransferase